MTAKTVAERQAAFRKARKDRPEVRGIFADTKLHPAIKDIAKKMATSDFVVKVGDDGLTTIYIKHRF